MRAGTCSIAVCLVALAAAGCAGDADAPGPRRSTAQPPQTDRWRLLYAAEARGRRGLDVYVVDVPGGRPVRVGGVDGRDDFSPSWSPDGKSIVFRRNPRRGDEGEIFLAELTTGATKNLTRTPRVADWSPVFAPTGGEIAYFSFPSGSGDLWLMRPDGTRRRRLTRDGTINEYPTFDPDGSRVAYQSHRDGNFEIYVIGRDGRGERRLTNHSGRDQWPAWSRDGRLIAFMSERNGSEDVYVVHPDGSGLRNVTETTSLDESHPAWAPDGRLTFTRHADGGPVELWAVEPDGGDAVRLDTTAEPVFVYDWTTG